MFKRHPVDQLFALREQITTLQAEQRAVEAYLNDHPNDRHGEEYTAAIYFNRVLLSKRTVALSSAEDTPTVKPVDTLAVKSDANVLAWVVPCAGIITTED